MPPQAWAVALGAVGNACPASSLLDTGALTFAYDGAKRLTGLTKGSLTENQAYDRGGNVTSESRSFPGVSGDAGTTTQSFVYDALSRVTSSAGLASGSRSYTYDRDGNRRTEAY